MCILKRLEEADVNLIVNFDDLGWENVFGS